MSLALKVLITLLYLACLALVALKALDPNAPMQVPSLLEATASYAILIALIMFAERFPKSWRGE